MDCNSRYGLYSAFMKKGTGMVQILTIQGSRDHIAQLGEALVGYLRQAGGAVNCQYLANAAAAIDAWFVRVQPLTSRPLFSQGYPETIRVRMETKP